MIDEVAGQAIPLSFFHGDLALIIFSFTLFRFFDIAKPAFIGWADRSIHGPLGTLLDDLFAGLCVLALLVLDSILFKIIV